MTHSWSQRFGSSSFEMARGVGVDASGNITIAGTFGGTVDFGGGPLTTAGAMDVFFAKFTPGGTPIWSQQFGDAADGQEPLGLGIDPAGNCISMGRFWGTMNFGGGPLLCAGSEDIFLVKLDPNGAHLWSKSFGDASSQLGTGLAFDPTGNVILSGYTQGTVNFGGGPLTSAGGWDIFVTKFDPSGTHLWSKRFGTAGGELAQDVSTDTMGNIVLVGYFDGTVDFGGGPLTSAGGLDAFVAKFDPNGNHLWSQSFGDGSFPQQAEKVICDSSGDIIVTGYLQGTVDFGGGTLASAGAWDSFIVKFDTNGTHVWSKTFGSTLDQFVQCPAVDPLDNIYASGYFFGNIDLGGGVLTSAGERDLFLAKFDSAGNHMWSDRYGDANQQRSWFPIVTSGANDLILAGESYGTIDFGGGPLTSAGNRDVVFAKFSDLSTISVAPEFDISTCSDNITFSFSINNGGGREIRGYEVTFQIDPAVATITNTGTDVTEFDYLSSVGGTAFYVIDRGAGEYTVSCAILGGTIGATGDGDLFSIELTPVAEGASDILVTNLKLREPDNTPLPAGSSNAVVQIDCTPPLMQAIVEAEGECYNEAPTFATFTFRDEVNLDLAEYQIDSDGWNSIFSAWPDTVWTSPGWELPGFAGLNEGTHTVVFRVKDDAGNWNGEGTPDTYTWSFTKDTVPPAAPTDFLALPGYDRVHLTWTNPTGDASFVGIEIRKVGWTDYPQYGTPGPTEPAYPADETEGSFVTQTSLETYDEDPGLPRDIYYYAAFSYDCAGNYSAATPTSRDRSTSYWLGDISPANVGDGNVQIGDLSAFSLAFGSIQGGIGWNPESDIGPTDDYSGIGIPLPDDMVEFEDLMIVALNYGNVSPLGTSERPLIATAPAPLVDQVSFRLIPLDRNDREVTYSVEICNNADVLKGFSVTLSYGVGTEVVAVKASRSLVGKGSEHFFGTIERENGSVDICVAALGNGKSFDFSGEIATVTVRETGSPVTIRLARLRDIRNRGDDIVLDEGEVDSPFVPAVTGLIQNHPNPFNPVTTITYDIATAGHVSVEVYDVSGRLVRRLVNTHKEAGRHQVSWNGRDTNDNQVHTGVYFYRMIMPGYTSPAKKMLLLK